MATKMFRPAVLEEWDTRFEILTKLDRLMSEKTRTRFYRYKGNFKRHGKITADGQAYLRGLYHALMFPNYPGLSDGHDMPPGKTIKLPAHAHRKRG